MHDENRMVTGATTGSQKNSLVAEEDLPVKI